MKCVTAKKDYRCDECGKRIPKGSRYWQKHETHGDSVNSKEHANCLDFAKEAELREDFNINRPKGN